MLMPRIDLGGLSQDDTIKESSILIPRPLSLVWI